MNFDVLRRSVAGEVITRDEANCAATRNALVWNGRKPERYPDAIVRVASVADVQAAVRFTAEAELRVSARGAGHQFSGIAVQEGLVLDLSALNHIDIDADAMIAEVGGDRPQRGRGQCLRRPGACRFLRPLRLRAALGLPARRRLRLEFRRLGRGLLQCGKRRGRAGGWRGPPRLRHRERRHLLGGAWRRPGILRHRRVYRLKAPPLPRAIIGVAPPMDRRRRPCRRPGCTRR